MTVYMPGSSLQQPHAHEAATMQNSAIPASMSFLYHVARPICLLVLLLHALPDPPDTMQYFPQTHVAFTFTNMLNKYWTQYLFPAYVFRASVIGLLFQHCYLLTSCCIVRCCEL